MTAVSSCHWGRLVCTCRPVYLQTSFFDFVLLCSNLGSTAVGVEYSYPTWGRLSWGAVQPWESASAPPPPSNVYKGLGGLAGWLDRGGGGGAASKTQNPPASNKRCLPGNAAFNWVGSEGVGLGTARLGYNKHHLPHALTTCA